MTDRVQFEILNEHAGFKEERLPDRYYTFNDVDLLIGELVGQPLFDVQTAGVSEEGREIRLIKSGRGKIRVFMWAQMHGDEPTANAALFDLMKFFRNPGRFSKLRDEILDNLTIWIMPLVNPDGAERFTRENASGVDLNRDAHDLTTPEANVLMNAFRNIKPDFAFNLHDQGRAHAAGDSGKPATISFLAPPPDDKNSIPPKRLNAKKLISNLVDHLQKLIPGHIGRYSEEFEYRAFGDSFQALGAATILVESGGWEDDIERRFQRSLNFFLFITAFKSIIPCEYLSFDTKLYDELPGNKKVMYDLLIRGVSLQGKIVNIGVNRIEVPSKKGRPVIVKGTVKRIGKLRNRRGYKEIDGTGLSVVPPVRNGGRADFVLQRGEKKVYEVNNGTAKEFPEQI
ncbi:MAG: peptidase M14 [Ignavibacteria bacterium]|nr:peptidase M14 [Ignavibacteria bacterium]